MMYFASRLHRYCGMGLFFSVVSTQIFRVSFHGLRNAKYFPSGDTCALIISGLPKISSRSMIGGSPFVAATFCPAGADLASVPIAHFSATAVDFTFVVPVDFSCAPSHEHTSTIANTIFQICLMVRTLPFVMTYDPHPPKVSTRKNKRQAIQAGISDFNFILAQNDMLAALWCQPQTA